MADLYVSADGEVIAEEAAYTRPHGVTDTRLRKIVSRANG